MKIIDLETKQDYQIDLFKSGGEEKMVCPKCSADRKKKNQKVFSWNHSKEVGFCSHCNASFVVYKEFTKKYIKPLWKNNTKLSDNVVNWFDKRGIKQMTLRDFQLSEGMEFMPQVNKEVNTIQFNYFRDKELINVKYRDGQKNFKLHKDSELIFYNYDNVKGLNEIIICEGEIDCLSIYECGHHNVVSVPNGASGQRMEYLDNCIELFGQDTKIILATDNDLPGVQMRNELASRLGIENCYIVNFGECKDANEYLIKYGTVVLHEAISNAKKYPVEGIFTSDDFIDEIYSLYENGLNPAFQIGFEAFDKLMSFDFSRLITVTGIPGHGKSEFVDQIVIRLNTLFGLRAAYFSPENYPLELHASKIIEKLIGKRFSKNEISKQNLEIALEYYRDNFFSICPEDDFTVETILKKARYLVKSKGIKILIIDPYNTLEHKKNGNENETEYVSRFLDELRNFAKRNRIMIFLVAHPTKMQKNNGVFDIPNMYSISGSSNFYNKTDFGLCVYRTNTDDTEVYVQKVKFKHLGERGVSTFKWNKQNGRYSECNTGTMFIEDNRSWIKINEDTGTLKQIDMNAQIESQRNDAFEVASLEFDTVIETETPF